MSTAWEPRTNQPDTPVVDSRLWRGVALGLPLSLVLWWGVIAGVRWAL